MGKGSKKIVASEDEMEEEVDNRINPQPKPQIAPLSKKKVIQKQKVSGTLHRPAVKEQKKTVVGSGAVLKKIAKQVNLTRPTMSLE